MALAYGKVIRTVLLDSIREAYGGNVDLGIAFTQSAKLDILIAFTHAKAIPARIPARIPVCASPCISPPISAARPNPERRCYICGERVERQTREETRESLSSPRGEPRVCFGRPYDCVAESRFCKEGTPASGRQTDEPGERLSDACLVFIAPDSVLSPPVQDGVGRRVEDALEEHLPGTERNSDNELPAER
jgi:hypothetical protein